MKNGLTDQNLKSQLAALVAPAATIFVNAKLEEEMSGMDRAERKDFLGELWRYREDALGELIKAAYLLSAFNLFYRRQKRVPWPGRLGKNRPAAVGAIHTDFERGFIAANICNFSDLKTLGSEQAVKPLVSFALRGKPTWCKMEML